MRRTLVAVTLTTSLLAPTWGQPPLGSLWTFLSSLWGGAITDAGCGADPDGRCALAPQPTTDEGCGADPDGRCALAPQLTPHPNG
jgi:hypothetical protein